MPFYIAQIVGDDHEELASYSVEAPDRDTAEHIVREYHWIEVPLEEIKEDEIDEFDVNTHLSA